MRSQAGSVAQSRYCSLVFSGPWIYGRKSRPEPKSLACGLNATGTVERTLFAMVELESKRTGPRHENKVIFCPASSRWSQSRS